MNIIRSRRDYVRTRLRNKVEWRFPLFDCKQNGNQIFIIFIISIRKFVERNVCVWKRSSLNVLIEIDYLLRSIIKYLHFRLHVYFDFEIKNRVPISKFNHCEIFYHFCLPFFFFLYNLFRSRASAWFALIRSLLGLIRKIR